MTQTPRTLTDAYVPDRLIAGLTQPVSETKALILGQVLLRGSLVGLITASGKLTLSVQAAADGSQVPYGILADDADATASDVTCGVFVKGEFNQNAVIFGAGQTPANVHDALRGLGIFLKTSVPALSS